MSTAKRVFDEMVTFNATRGTCVGLGAIYSKAENDVESYTFFDGSAISISDDNFMVFSPSKVVN